METSVKNLILLLALVAAAINPLASAEQATPVKTVLISKAASDSGLNENVKGIIDGLKAHGLSRGINLDMRIESANASSTIAEAIAIDFMNRKPDVVVGIGTVSAQSFINYASTNKVKLVFSAVTDPIRANLALGNGLPKSNIAGISDFIDPEVRVILIRKFQPKLKNLGILYNPEESNSISTLEYLEKACEKFQINLIKQAASKASEVEAAAINLADNTEAILIDNDNTAFSEIQSIMAVAAKAKKPVYLSEPSAVKNGALAGLGADQYKIGLETAEIINKFIEGENLDSAKFGYPTTTDLRINLATAKALGISVPNDLMNEASEIIGKSK